MSRRSSVTPVVTAGKAKLNRNTLSHSPIALLDMLAGPICQTRQFVFLRPTAQLAVAAQRAAIEDMRHLWQRLRQALLEVLYAEEVVPPKLRAREHVPPTFRAHRVTVRPLRAVEVMPPKLRAEESVPATRRLQLPDPATYESPYVQQDRSKAEGEACPTSPVASHSPTLNELRRQLPFLQGHGVGQSTESVQRQQLPPTIPPMCERERAETSASEATRHRCENGRRSATRDVSPSLFRTHDPDPDGTASSHSAPWEGGTDAGFVGGPSRVQSVNCSTSITAPSNSPSRSSLRSGNSTALSPPAVSMEFAQRQLPLEHRHHHQHYHHQQQEQPQQLLRWHSLLSLSTSSMQKGRAEDGPLRQPSRSVARNGAAENGMHAPMLNEQNRPRSFHDSQSPPKKCVNGGAEHPTTRTRSREEWLLERQKQGLQGVPDARTTVTAAAAAAREAVVVVSAAATTTTTTALPAPASQQEAGVEKSGMPSRTTSAPIGEETREGTASVSSSPLRQPELQHDKAKEGRKSRAVAPVELKRGLYNEPIYEHLHHDPKQWPKQQQECSKQPPQWDKARERKVGAFEPTVVPLSAPAPESQFDILPSTAHGEKAVGLENKSPLLDLQMRPRRLASVSQSRSPTVSSPCRCSNIRSSTESSATKRRPYNRLGTFEHLKEHQRRRRHFRKRDADGRKRGARSQKGATTASSSSSSGSDERAASQCCDGLLLRNRTPSEGPTSRSAGVEAERRRYALMSWRHELGVEINVDDARLLPPAVAAEEEEARRLALRLGEKASWPLHDRRPMAERSRGSSPSHTQRPSQQHGWLQWQPASGFRSAALPRPVASAAPDACDDDDEQQEQECFEDEEDASSAPPRAVSQTRCGGDRMEMSFSRHTQRP
ncbi:hypothetical protein DQ04_15491000 [Trypanosoma grayi]|uniref:hypothetical protein n=1 Tax=Trypanosoma grayi TaxID=71804 RepID=UPI0004F42B61|nr:hypothetical protein DQ04_15491000 [Trypanosoma grayi]KEG06176.1 hypothetical protein DQ04_15491000 [Trypanosoma grayi]